METVDIFGEYKVYLGLGILDTISDILKLNNFSKVIVITDEKIPTNILSQYEKIIVPAGEQNKTIETVEIIWKKLLELKADRKTLVINLGGGVIGDMGGFAASTYMRGIKFVQAPTTVLSSVDASVGGKVGIDFAGIKNLIGAFNQPVAVIVDINTFDSLPDREFISGFGEIIKHGAIADSDYFEKVTSKDPREFTKAELLSIIKRSCEIKAEIISGDEKESGNRKLLNYGHTIGHALESASLETDNPLLHGEAVGLGMIAEAQISQAQGLCDQEVVNRLGAALSAAGLPIKLHIKDTQQIIDLISKDKKSEGGKVNWTLIKKIGEASINQSVSEQELKSALEVISE